MGAMKDLLITIYGGGDEAVEAAKKLAPEWIPVSERLPNEGEPVLAFCPMIGTQVAHVTEEGAWYWGTSGCLGYTATHWMPLPEPPEVK